MAYLNFTEAMAPAGARATAETSRPDVAPQPGLSALEWSVVALAAHDGLASLRPAGPIARALARLLGEGSSRTLANPRLEALRRLAVLGWHHGYNLPRSAYLAAAEAGFQSEHVDMLLARIAPYRTPGRGRSSL